MYTDEIDIKQLEHVWYRVQWGTTQPNTVVTTADAYKWIKSRFAAQKEKEEEEEDSFLTWVTAVRTEAKKPKNHELRKFLGTSRWERR